jgi:hypothetical protein
VRNGVVEPADAYWVDFNRRVFTPSVSPGAEVHWQLYDGFHSWPAVANTWVVDFVKSL